MDRQNVKHFKFLETKINHFRFKNFRYFRDAKNILAQKVVLPNHLWKITLQPEPSFLEELRFNVMIFLFLILLTNDLMTRVKKLLSLI